MPICALKRAAQLNARSAYDLGYNVVFVVDAMADRDSEIHQRCVTKAFPKLGKTETTDGVLEAISGT